MIYDFIFFYSPFIPLTFLLSALNSFAPYQTEATVPTDAELDLGKKLFDYFRLLIGQSLGSDGSAHPEARWNPAVADSVCLEPGPSFATDPPDSDDSVEVILAEKKVRIDGQTRTLEMTKIVDFQDRHSNCFARLSISFGA